jgi:hypothetical protein
MTRTQQRRMQMSRQILNRSRRRPVLEERPLTRDVHETPRALTDQERDEVIAHDVDRLHRKDP